MRRRWASLLVVVVLAALVGAPSSAACTSRLLVLSAFPGEIDPLLREAQIDATETVDGRRFFVGTLRGNDVVLALTGIGLVNAERTTEAALDRFGCGDGGGIRGIVFSGVSGGQVSIGDVVIPAEWTADDGETWHAVDEEMFATAASVAESGVALLDTVPVGDLACVGIDPTAVPTIGLDRAPKIYPGGKGRSSDPFDGRAFPCVPGGGDVFGCEPCRSPSGTIPDVPRFVGDVIPFADPAFFFGYFESPPSTGDDAAADMESAAVARVADAAGIPFIAFRALSDGNGDPLMLPGFPFQFFFYRQLAAENAATVALAFLDRLA